MTATPRGSSFKVEINYLETRYRKLFKMRAEAGVYEVEAKLNLLKGASSTWATGPL